MHMDTVSHTLFYPLFGRATASHNWPELFPDPWARQAEEIARAEGTTAQALGSFPAVVYGLRHLMTVTNAKRYLETHPGAAVVNIGCGLDSLTQDLAGEACTIYNLDFPDVIELRHRWIPNGENEIDLPYSFTDHEWMNDVDASKGIIAMAPGVFYYIEVDEVRAAVQAMAERFPGGRLSYESESPLVMTASEKAIARTGTPCKMPFRLKDPYTPRTWSNKISNVEVEFDFSNYLTPQQRLQLSRGHRFGFAMFKLIRGMYQVTIDFAGTPEGNNTSEASGAAAEAEE